LNFKNVESTFIPLTNRIKKSVSGQAEGGLVPPPKRFLDPNCGFRQGNSIKGLTRKSMMPRGGKVTAKLIKGNEIVQQIREELKREAVQFREKYNLIPSMVTIVVGENPASLSYLIAKHKTCKELGFSLIQDIQPESIIELQLLKLINKYNRDSKIHGVLVQLPLPKHVDETSILYAIDPQKDIDGFHPANVGKLVIGEADYLPCTAAGIQQLLIRSGIKIDGAEVVVVGRSNLVGKPIG
jgi:methylenetetrahydrofolate dehydrogenase (NADP+)/methenyltetrahydrofolate cyclohydrolase